MSCEHIKIVDFPYCPDNTDCMYTGGTTWDGIGIEALNEDATPMDLTGLVIKMNIKRGNFWVAKWSSDSVGVIIDGNKARFGVAPDGKPLLEFPNINGELEYHIDWIYPSGLIVTHVKGVFKIKKV